MHINQLFSYMTSGEIYHFFCARQNSSVKFLTKNTPINDVNYAGYISASYLSHSHSCHLICYCDYLVILIHHSLLFIIVVVVVEDFVVVKNIFLMFHPYSFNYIHHTLHGQRVSHLFSEWWAISADHAMHVYYYISNCIFFPPAFKIVNRHKGSHRQMAKI